MASYALSASPSALIFSKVNVSSSSASPSPAPSSLVVFIAASSSASYLQDPAVFYSVVTIFPFFLLLLSSALIYLLVKQVPAGPQGLVEDVLGRHAPPPSGCCGASTTSVAPDPGTLTPSESASRGASKTEAALQEGAFEQKRVALERSFEARLLSERAAFERSFEAKREALERTLENRLLIERRERIEFKNDIESRLLHDRGELELHVLEVQNSLALEAQRAAISHGTQLEELSQRLQGQMRSTEASAASTQLQLASLGGQISHTSQAEAGRAERDRMRVQALVQEEFAAFSRQQSLALESSVTSALGRVTREVETRQAALREQLLEAQASQQAALKEQFLDVHGSLQQLISVKDQLEEVKGTLRGVALSQHSSSSSVGLAGAAPLPPQTQSLLAAAAKGGLPSIPQLAPEEDPHHIQRPLETHEFIKFTDIASNKVWYENPTTGSSVWELPKGGAVIASSFLS